MSSRTVVFVGARLKEAPFYHYLAVRSRRLGSHRDFRAKAFLVSPTISPLRSRILRGQNIVPCPMKAETFFRQLRDTFPGHFPGRIEILHSRYPHQLKALERNRAPAALLRQFDLIVPDQLPPSAQGKRSLLYMGAEPTWADIAADVDALRGCSTSLIETLQKPYAGVRTFLLTGYAGSGKTATVMRAACELARSGNAVYFFRGHERLDPAPVVDLARSLGTHGAFLFVDRAAGHFRPLQAVAEQLDPSVRLTLVLSDRSHVAHQRMRLLGNLQPTVLSMPELDRDDTERILDRLEQHGFLGILQARPRREQVNAFLVRARKQLLVALREATSGKGFDAILAEEFASLESDNARLAYTIASLAVMHGAPGVRRRHLLACLDGDDQTRARTLTDDLKDVVVPVGSSAELLAPRHRLIGRYVAEETSPFQLRHEALLRLLTQVSRDVTPESIRRRVPEYLAYRGLINFDNLCELFGKDYDVLVDLYESLKPIYMHGANKGERD